MKRLVLLMLVCCAVGSAQAKLDKYQYLCASPKHQVIHLGYIDKLPDSGTKLWNETARSAMMAGALGSSLHGDKDRYFVVCVCWKRPCASDLRKESK